MTRKWPQDEPPDVAARVVAVRQRLTGGLQQADYGPVRSLGYSLRHLCRDIAWVLPVHLLGQPRGNLSFPDDPSAYAAEV